MTGGEPGCYRRRMAEEPPPQDTSPKVDLDWDTEPDPLHANVILVAPLQPDMFAMVFADGIPVRFFADREGVVAANIVSSLRIPASSMSEFVDAITTAWNRYVEAQATTPNRHLYVYSKGEPTVSK